MNKLKLEAWLAVRGARTMAVRLEKAQAKAADEVCQQLHLVRHATSLGAVESTIERRAAVRGQKHLPPSLLRLSVGVECCSDLQADLERALRR